MPRDMFGDVVDPSIKVGSQKWYTVPLSIVVHTAVIGAVVIAGPHIRLTEEKMLGLAPQLMEAARELSLAMMATPALSQRRPSGQSSFFDSPP